MARINYDFQELRSFVAVAELGNFRAAAEDLAISAPALSRRIERLEAMLGTRLLERTTRRVSLTNVGRTFLEHARAALDELEGATLSITEMAQRRVGQVTVACVPSVVHYFLPSVLASYRARYPNIRIRIVDASANEALATVAEGRADFGLNFVGAQEAGIDFRPFYQERFVLAVRNDSPLARRKRVTWEEAATHPFMTVSRASGNRLLLDVELGKAGIRLDPAYEVSHVSTLLGLVEAGLGVAAVPRLALPLARHPTLCSVPVVQPVVRRTLGFVTRHGKGLSPPAQLLVTMLREATSRRTRPSAAN